MNYNNEEAVKVYNRVKELCELHDLTIKNACHRVGLNPTSFSTLERRVKKILSIPKPEPILPPSPEDVPAWLKDRYNAFPLVFKD